MVLASTQLVYVLERQAQIGQTRAWKTLMGGVRGLLGGLQDAASQPLEGGGLHAAPPETLPPEYPSLRRLS